MAKRILIALLVLYTAAHFVHGVFAYNGAGDWKLHRSDVQGWVAHGAFNWQRASENSFNYTTASPLHALSVMPFLFLPADLGAKLALALNALLICFVFYFASLGVSPNHKKAWWFFSLVIVLNFRPFLLGMSMMKVEFIELFFISLCFHLFKKERDTLAGCSLAIAALLKYVPGFLIFFFLAKRETRSCEVFC